MSADLISRFGKLFSDKSFKALMKSYDNLLVTGMSMDKKLSKPTFVLAILQSFKNSKELTGEELERIFHYLDTNNNGFLELDEFIAGVRGVLNELRQSAVNFVFSKLDLNKSGYIEEDELTEFFVKAPLPDILLGQIKPAIKSALFVKKYGHNHRLSIDDLTDYYISKSVKIASDDKFISNCLGEWLFKEDDFEVFRRDSNSSRAATASPSNAPLPVRRGSSALLRRRASVEFAQSIAEAVAAGAGVGAGVGASAAIDRFDMLTRTGKRPSVSEITSDRLNNTIHCISAPREPANAGISRRLSRSQAHGDLANLDSSIHSLPSETRSSNQTARPIHRGRKTSPADMKSLMKTVSGSFMVQAQALAQTQGPSEPTNSKPDDADFPTLSPEGPEAPRRIVIPSPSDITKSIDDAMRLVNSVPFSPSQGHGQGQGLVQGLDATVDRNEYQSSQLDDRPAVGVRLGNGTKTGTVTGIEVSAHSRERRSSRIKEMDADVLLLRASRQTPTHGAATGAVGAAEMGPSSTIQDLGLTQPIDPKVMADLNTSVESLSCESESSADDSAQIDLAVIPSGGQNLAIHLTLLVDELQKSVTESRAVVMKQQKAIDNQEKMIENIRKALAQLSVAAQGNGYPKT